MHFYQNERIALFIDGANLYATAKSLGFDIDYKRLLALFRQKGQLVRALYYTALAEDQEYSSIRPLIDWLDYATGEQLVAYLDACLPGNDFAPSLSELFSSKTRGLPLFAARWLQALRDRGQLGQRGRWGLARDLSELESSAPGSLMAAIRQGLAHLPTSMQQALAFASIEGDEFRTGVLAEALARSACDVELELAELGRREGWLVHVGQEALPDGVLTERYRFAHVLYQTVLYDGLSRQRRIALHRRAALTLEAHGCAHHGRFLAELAWHQERGRRFSRAVATLLRAAEHANRIAAPREASSYSARAQALLAKLPESEQPAALQQKRELRA